MIDSQSNGLKLSAAFTAGALLYAEVKAVLPLLLQENHIILLDQESKGNNLLKIKTEAARIRVVTELKKRVRVIEPFFWSFFEDRQEKEQRLALLYLVLKTYPLAFDLHFEVVLKKWRSLDFNIERFDLQMRLDEISSQNDEVAQWTEATRTKLLTNYLRMLREAGLLGRTRLKQPEHIDSSFWEYFVAAGAPWFLEACFLPKIERETYL